MSLLIPSDSFEYLCYGSTASINILFPKVWGSTLYVKSRSPSCKNYSILFKICHVSIIVTKRSKVLSDIVTVDITM